mmetsp:Transcript_106298/g.129623  ORF Transcript_106298/g.129623 Transcript_106298/m.129623 type:complete len:228 (-) Transcript_106298:75-758(-)
MLALVSLLLGVAFSAEKVNLDLYFEALCPYCTQYQQGTFRAAWSCPEFTDMANLTWIPYGNAQEKQESNGEWQFTCQHGSNECNGNLVETCYINLVNFDQNQWVPFQLAFDKELNANSRTNALTVAQKVLSSGNYNVTYDALSACYNGKTGNTYEHEMGVLTEAERKQGMKGTPWIVLNGKYDSACQSNTLKCVCGAYTGQNACCKAFGYPTNVKPKLCLPDQMSFQ